MNSRLQAEVNDPFLLEAYKELIDGFEVQYSLYIDTEKESAVFLEDKEYGLDGPPPFKHLTTHYKAGESIYFEDLFRGKKFIIKDTPQNLKWNISKETLTIGNFKCKKAALIGDPFKTIVWFTEDYPLAFGPYLGNGLPGLVVLLENDYYSIKVKEIKKENLSSKILKKINSTNTNKGISIKDYHKEAQPILQTMSQENITN
jgi:GLPGLI family protein